MARYYVNNPLEIELPLRVKPFGELDAVELAPGDTKEVWEKEAIWLTRYPWLKVIVADGNSFEETVTDAIPLPSDVPPTDSSPELSTDSDLLAEDLTSVPETTIPLEDTPKPKRKSKSQ